MAQTLTLPKSSHKMVHCGARVNTLTGEEWEFYECPLCGYLCKIQWEPYQTVDLRLGDGMLTADDIGELQQLVKTPEGRIKANDWLISLPSHSMFKMPTEDELRQMAQDNGLGAEFEAAVDQSIIDGKPLVSLGMGGHTAETWPRGTGPTK